MAVPGTAYSRTDDSQSRFLFVHPNGSWRVMDMPSPVPVEFFQATDSPVNVISQFCVRGKPARVPWCPTGFYSP
jgi:hypothetical protein